MRLLVCGDRDWTDRRMIFDILQQWAMVYDDSLVIIHGAARGADRLAGEAARDPRLNLPVYEFPADWNRYPKAAGPIRNKRMLDEGKAEFVLAFHDDFEHSKGTKNMVEQAKKRGLGIWIISHNGITRIPRRAEAE